MKGNTIQTTFVVLGLVVCCLIGIPNVYDKFLIARFIATAMGLAILFLFAFVTKKRWVIPNTGVFLLYMAFAVLSGCSLLWATNTAEAVYSASTTLMGFLVTLVTYTLYSQHPVTFKKTLWVSAAVILVVYLTFTLLQLFHIQNLSFDQLYRVTGINGHKNLLAIMLFVLSSFLLTTLPFAKSKILKAFPILLFVISITVVILLKSRAVWISACVAVVLFGIMTAVHQRKSRFSKRTKAVTLVIAVIFVFAFLTLGLRWFAHRSVPHTAEKSEVEYNPLSTSSLAERCLLWEKTYRIADQHPLSGCGAGNWQIQFPNSGLEGLYRSDVWNVHFTKPHNEYLEVLSEIGYPGLLLYITFLVSLIVLSFFALCENQNHKDFLLGAIILSIFTGCCVNALFDFPNSRVEHLVWMGIFIGFLLSTITTNKQKKLGNGWSILFLLLSVVMLVVGGFRLKGEQHSDALQQAMKKSDWNAMERHSQQALSPFYTIDAVGLPLHWYQGKAQKRMGNPQALLSFRQAWHNAPYCKENLNDLGLEEYHTAHQLEKAEFFLKEAIRISPNYLYPYFNLAYTYLHENELGKAKEVTDQIYMDEHKRDILINDAQFFEPLNTEAARQKIDAEYQATLQLRRIVGER